MLVAVPPPVVTAILPVVAAVGTTTVTEEAEATLNIVAAMPLNFTAVAPIRLVPETVTVDPGAPDGGVNAVIFGTAYTVKLVALLPVPAVVVTEIFPVAAPAGTIALIHAAEFTVNEAAATPSNFTDVAPVKFAPLITRVVPGGPDAGENVEITGGSMTVKPAELVAVPPGVVTLTLPVAAVAGTTAVTEVADRILMVSAAVPSNFTADAAVRLVPKMVTVVPMGPDAGVNDVIVGGATAFTVNTVAEFPVPAGVVTEIIPDLAVLGTVALIESADATW